MKQFEQLIRRLDSSNSTNVKRAALKSYFEQAEDTDRIWTVALFTHRRPKGIVKSAELRSWAAELAGIPDWLFEETYHIVGDLAETISGVLPENDDAELESLSGLISRLVELKGSDESVRREYVLGQWSRMNRFQRFIFNKLLTGGFRIGVSQQLMSKALADFSGKDESEIAHRLMGNWDPFTTDFNRLIFEDNEADKLSRPYPFYLAYPLEQEVSELGPITEWQAEWKWDGIRGQLIRRKGQTFVWSRGEELMQGRFPEIEEAVSKLDADFVLDGEIMALKGDEILPFQLLQKRINRKSVGKKLLEEAPVGFIAYDLLELQGADLREQSMSERRRALEKLLPEGSDGTIRLSEIIRANDWNELTEIRGNSREMRAEGLMLKRRDSSYQSGRKRGDWWKWKIDPLHLDAVMVYAQRGHGRRANLYTDFTFALWSGEELVTFAKAYSGLTDEEFREVNRFIQQNSLDKFGPVRVVKPELVFEIAFEGIAASPRHKSGVAVRFPRIARWRRDKAAPEANRLQDLLDMLDVYG